MMMMMTMTTRMIKMSFANPSGTVVRMWLCVLLQCSSCKTATCKTFRIYLNIYGFMWRSKGPYQNKHSQKKYHNQEEISNAFQDLRLRFVSKTGTPTRDPKNPADANS